MNNRCLDNSVGEALPPTGKQLRTVAKACKPARKGAKPGSGAFRRGQGLFRCGQRTFRFGGGLFALVHRCALRSGHFSPLWACIRRDAGVVRGGGVCFAPGAPGMAPVEWSLAGSHATWASVADGVAPHRCANMKGLVPCCRIRPPAVETRRAKRPLLWWIVDNHVVVYFGVTLIINVRFFQVR